MAPTMTSPEPKSAFKSTGQEGVFGLAIRAVMAMVNSTKPTILGRLASP
jgi:hypothetical protein